MAPHAGLLVYGNDDDYVKLDVAAVNDPGQPASLRAELVSEHDGQVGNGGERSIPLTGAGGWWHLRLEKTGNAYAGFVSSDGQQWRPLGDPVTNQVPAAKVGLLAVGPGQTQGPVTVGFDRYGLVRVDKTAPVTTATVGPTQPDGTDGWWRTRPKVSLSADDGPGGFGVARTEYRIGGGAWTPYTEVFTINADGDQTVEFRSTDQTGNTETAKSVRVRLDTTAPVPKVSGVRAGGSYGDSIDLTLGLSGTDATSGLAGVTATLDGTARPAGVVPLHQLALGDHTLVVTATDKAGNTATVTIGFTVRTSFADAETLIDRFETERRLDRLTGALLARDLGEAGRHERKAEIAEAVQTLEGFIARVDRDVRDPGVAQVLRRDATALIAELRR